MLISVGYRGIEGVTRKERSIMDRKEATEQILEAKRDLPSKR